jgi:hypothetical protein
MFWTHQASVSDIIGPNAVNQEFSMKNPVRIRLAVLFVCATALAVAYHEARLEQVMAESAQHFLNSLTADQTAKSNLAFDSADRTLWHFVPDNNFETTHGHPRPGLTYSELESHQRRLADALLSSGYSKSGFGKAVSIMSLEDILRQNEKDTTGRRDPMRYHVTVFGKPAVDGTWGWRVEGHHISVNYTIKNGQIVSSTPTFFGANPHEVREGPRSGLRPLAREEDVARKLAQSLTPEQRKAAVVDEKAYRDILTAFQTRAKLEDQAPGIAASKLTAQQYEMLVAVLEEYAYNMPAGIAEKRMKQVKDTPKDKLLFAWAGSIEPGQGDYYRIQAPEFLVEYDNTQNNNNHSHSVWRDFNGDFGFDVLAMHHRQFDHGLAPVAAAD